MAREYARIKTDIWNDPEFRALPSGPQRLYHLILEQPDLSLCGVIRPAFARWADFASDTTVKSIRRDSQTLEANRYILLDEQKDELLVRTFVRHDIILTSPNVIVGLSNAFAATHSQCLREIVIFELGRAKDQGLMKRLPEGLAEKDHNRLSKPFIEAWRDRLVKP